MFKETRTLLKSPNLWVTIIGIALVPALYCLVFLSSMWNPYAHFNQFPVAVVNQDKGASLDNKSINVGNEMVDTLSKNKDLDFHFVSEKTAQEKLDAGKYYMIITFPDNFSSKVASVMTKNPEKATITYETSKGHNFISSKISESAMIKLESKVSKTLTKTYNEKLFAKLGQLQDGMGQAAQGSQKLSNGSKEAASGSQQISDNLRLLANSSQTFTAGANKLANGINQYTGGVSQLHTGINSLSDGLFTYTDGVNKLSAGANQLDSKSSELLSGAKQLTAGSAQIQQLAEGANNLQAALAQMQKATTPNPENTANIQALITGLPQLQARINQLNGAVSALPTDAVKPVNLSSLTTAVASIKSQAESLASAAALDKSNTLAAVQSTGAYASLTAGQQAEITAAINNSPSSSTNLATSISEKASAIDEGLKTISTSAQQLASLVGQLTTLQTSLAQINAGTNQALPNATSALTKLSAGMGQINSNLSLMVPGSQRLSGGIQMLQGQLSSKGQELSTGITRYTGAVSQLSNGASTLAAKNPQLRDGVTELNSGSNTINEKSGQLVDGGNQLADGASKMIDGSAKLAQGGNKLKDGIAALSVGTSTLAEKLAMADKGLSTVSFKKDNSNRLANPIKVSHKDKDNVKTNGVGMAPYMMSVALLVAAMAANIIFYDSLKGEKHQSRYDWAKSKLLINGLISSLASLVVYTTILFMGFEPNHKGLTFLVILLTSWALMAVVTALLGWDRRFGSFASLFFLLFQLGSSAGTYPLEICPPIFTKIGKFLPMSYSVAGLRQAISMTGNIAKPASMLALFTIGAMLVGLVIYRDKD
ncbi:YhgE/Pip domain-containing protein [Streptococcus iniae]|uniref:Putative membrane protein BUG1 n=2 Tax=Streptococcus iniae TaxID=1346 RepID=A3R738_STRIN|nr:YhgE/Pip domain-containing protein [Streptococcus iniae]AGM98184.1 putative membrane protein BUG1 [Streptococcus iniae SF1]ABO15445.1 putative membrane protein BUG1 [Streptococcus iniae]APD31299.1 hypothetical protein BMF34_02000 [Streptococcus iniae]AYB02233.1 YhgE/Pip domain-containing protein [Streptococcus iniae]AYB04100.1 YhgE/Pip domain-containing protein [Streptococcus iniae]